MTGYQDRMVVCAGCGEIIHQGDGDLSEASHGSCAKCTAEWHRECDEYERQQAEKGSGR